MEFRALIKYGSERLTFHYDVDDDATAHTLITEAITSIQKLLKKPERMPPKDVRAVTPSVGPNGGAK